MPTGGRGVVAQKVAPLHIVELGDGAAHSVGNNGTPLAVALAFDIPKLERVKKIAESHAVEIVGIEALLDIAEFHRAHEDFKSKPTAIAAARSIRICLGHYHALVPQILGDPVVNIVLPRLPTAVVGIRTVQRVT